MKTQGEERACLLEEDKDYFKESLTSAITNLKFRIYLFKNPIPASQTTLLLCYKMMCGQVMFGVINENHK